MSGDTDEIPSVPSEHGWLLPIGGWTAFSRGTNTIEERVHSDFKLLRP
jgi:hypothetical protein